MPIDYTYILILISLVVTLVASANVKITFYRYSKVANARGLTGRDVAKMILEHEGIDDVEIKRISGSLTDHYSPNELVLRLSDSVYDSASVAAIGVAAHECGHAIQHRDNYGPLKLRSLSVPLANIGSWLSWPLIVLGIIFDFLGLARIGVLLFTFVVLFQLITLPVEFDASKRAMYVLETGGILSEDELSGAGKVLKAAALTYVAALLTSILQLLRLVLIVGGIGGRRRN